MLSNHLNQPSNDAGHRYGYDIQSVECGWTSGSFFYHLTKLLYHDVAVVLQHWDVFVTVMILLGGAILNNSAVEMPPRTGAIITFLLR